MATKRGKLSRVETYYIDGHRNELSEQEIADNLNRGLKAVQKYLNENPVDAPKSAGTLAGQNIVTEKGTTIMTGAASEASDATRTRQLPASHARCTSKIHKD
jgi:hypothetical protein